jgi:hypothetical protein
MTIPSIVISRRDPLPGSGTTNIYVTGLNLTEVIINVPDKMLDTQVMWLMIERALANQRETHDIVMDGVIR